VRGCLKKLFPLSPLHACGERARVRGFKKNLKNKIKKSPSLEFF
jgi:hypothetical protein